MIHMGMGEKNKINGFRIKANAIVLTLILRSEEQAKINQYPVSARIDKTGRSSDHLGGA